jgi:hypothetical protein
VGDTASQDGSGASDDDEIAVVDGATELDQEIAYFHRLIIKNISKTSKPIYKQRMSSHDIPLVNRLSAAT